MTAKKWKHTEKHVGNIIAQWKRPLVGPKPERFLLDEFQKSHRVNLAPIAFRNQGIRTEMAGPVDEMESLKLYRHHTTVRSQNAGKSKRIAGGDVAVHHRHLKNIHMIARINSLLFGDHIMRS